METIELNIADQNHFHCSGGWKCLPRLKYRTIHTVPIPAAATWKDCTQLLANRAPTNAAWKSLLSGFEWLHLWGVSRYCLHGLRRGIDLMAFWLCLFIFIFISIEFMLVHFCIYQHFDFMLVHFCSYQYSDLILVHSLYLESWHYTKEMYVL